MFWSRLLVSCWTALLLLSNGLVGAQPVVAVPALSGQVLDLTNTLSAEQKKKLVDQLAALESSKGSQVAVLILPTTQPETIAEFSLRVAEAWKIGRGKVADPLAKGAAKRVDDGVLLVVAKNDRKIRIEVGYGLEGAIPDALAKRIITDLIAPKFREGDFAGGIENGVASLVKLIQGEALPAPPEVWQDGHRPAGRGGGLGQEDALGWLVPVIAALVFGFVLTSMFGRFFGAAITAGGTAFLLPTFGAPTLLALGAAALVFFVLLLFSGRRSTSMTPGRRNSAGPVFLPGGFGGGGGWGSGGGSSGGGFSGGGGSFGGGGASGDW